MSTSNSINFTGESDFMHQSTSGTPKRQFLGIYFRCCNVYSRVYKNDKGTAYEGRCPRCAAPVTIQVGKGGCSSRFFEASRS